MRLMFYNNVTRLRGFSVCFVLRLLLLRRLQPGEPLVDLRRKQSSVTQRLSASATAAGVWQHTWNKAFPFPGNSWVMSSFHARKASSSMISMS